MKEALEKLKTLHTKIIFNRQKNSFDSINYKLNKFIKNELFNMRLTVCILKQEELVELFEECVYIVLEDDSVFFDEENELTIKLYFESNIIIILEYDYYNNEIISFRKDFTGMNYR